MKKTKPLTLYTFIPTILVLVIVQLHIQSSWSYLIPQDLPHGTASTHLIDEINERVEWIRENELAFEKNISDTIIMLEAWFDGSDIVYFNRGYHGLGVLELDFYYDSYGKLVFIFLNGIELGSNNEEIYKQFNLYFYEDSLIKLEDVSSVHVEMGTSEIHDWLIDNVDGLLDSAYNEWKELIK